MKSMIEEKFPFESFIGGWYIPETVCDEIINFYDKNSQLRKEGRVGSNTPRIEKDRKESFDIYLQGSHSIYKNYIPELQKCLEKYIEKYEYCNYADRFSITETINIQKYPIGGGFKKFHYERMARSAMSRYLVFMTYLNNVEDGGTEFLYQKIQTPAKKGLTMIWPTEWTHTHRGIVSNTKEKIIVTGWYNFIS